MTKKYQVLTMTIATLMLLAMLTPAIVSPVQAAIPFNNPYDFISLTIGDPMDADPVFQYDQASLEMLFNIYDQLVFFDFTSSIAYEGMIADSWHGEIIDVTDPMTGLNYGQRWVFHIREGVYFHNSTYIDDPSTGHKSDSGINVPGEGNEVTVEDVEYSFERNMVTDASTGGECLIWDPLLHCGVGDTEDPLWGRKIDFAVQSNAETDEVYFYLLTPFEPFLQCVAQTYGAVMCKEWMVPKANYDGLGTTWHPDEWDGVWPDWSLPTGVGTQNYTRWTAYHDPDTSPIYYTSAGAIDYSSGTTHPHIDYCLGTGPYMLDYWDVGDRYRLTRNPYYWKGWSSPKHADNFVSRTIPTWETRRDVFLAGDGDTNTVPNQYKSQIENVEGLNCIAGLPQLTVNPACFFNQEISPLSTYCGTMPANGTFSSAGFPADGFTDIKLRKAFRAIFPYDTWLAAAYLGEAQQPATCVAQGLAYYDPTIPKPVTDNALAIKLLKEAWGGTELSPGPVWTNGFYMSFCYNSGNAPRQMACEMFRDEFENIDPKFHGEVTEILWTDYSSKWKTRVLPFYFVGWGADFPDAHNFVVPFMESVSGAFAKFQGIHNATIDQWIREGIDSIDPVYRQDRYTKLQQAYVDNCYSVAMAQPLARHWVTQYAHGFYYHSCMAGEEYAYYRWKESGAVSHDIAVTSSAEPGSWALTVKVKNLGVDNEFICINITYYDNQGNLQTLPSIRDWVKGGKTYTVTRDLPNTGSYGVAYIVTVGLSNWIHPLTETSTTNNVNKMVVAMKPGDLGTGPPPKFFKFDGLVNAADSGLFIKCYKGLGPW